MNKRKVYYQINTTNESFILLYDLLQKQGIKKNKFFLKLYDKSLAKVDPFDENLDLVTQAKIHAECKRNYWYFIRECVRIPVPGGKKRYEIHKGNCALSWCLLNNINTIELLPRQHGKTICAVVFYLWLYLFATTNSEMAFLNKKYDDSKLNLRRLKEIRECLPVYLQMIDPINETNNITRVESENTGNKIVAKPTATDEAGADNLGRGCTQPCQWYRND